MLVVVSDLHLQSDPHAKTRNLDPRSFRLFFEQIAQASRIKQAKELIVVFAGDIFEYIRSPLWLENDQEGMQLRPYLDIDPGQSLPQETDDRLWRIHQAIEQDERVAPTIELIEAVANGRDDIFTDGPRPRFLYIPGTSDRLANLSPRVNDRIREIFALRSRETDVESDQGDGSTIPRFPHRLAFLAGSSGDLTDAAGQLGLSEGSLDYGVVVQHGHEYDWLSCEFNHDENPLGRALTAQDEHLYDLSSLSDWIALDLVTKLTTRFVDQCGGDADQLIPVNEFIYRCLTDADDVRPQLRVLDYLMWRLDGDPWQMVRGLVREILDEAANSRYLRRWLDRHDHRWIPDRADKIRAVLGMLKRISDAVPDSFLANMGKKAAVRAGEDRATVRLLAEDPLWSNPQVHFICHGHFHEPSVTPLGVYEGVPKAAVCTGTWRRRHVQARDELSHVGLRSMAYAIFYRPEEQPGDQSLRLEFWNGQVLTHRPGLVGTDVSPDGADEPSTGATDV